MHWLWTWVYDRDGRYLGEVRGGNRLIADRARKTMTSGSMPFEPAAPRAPQARNVNSRPIAMPLGYEDFPTRERLGANSG